MTSYLDAARKAAPLVQVRGKAYFQNGQVRLVSFDGAHAELESYGTETYHVNLYFEGKKLTSYSCTCPFDRGMCKHVVASLYLLEMQSKAEPASMVVEAPRPGTSTLQAYLAYFEELGKSRREPMAYDVRRLGTRNLSPEDTETILTKTLELTIANSSSYGGEIGFYDNLVRLLAVDEATTGAKCLAKALPNLQKAAFRPLFRLFLRDNQAAATAYQKAALPFLKDLEIQTTGVYGRMSLELGELRRLVGGILPFAAKCYPGSAILTMKEARKRGLVEETKAIFLEVLRSGTFDYDAFCFVLPSLEKEERSAILREAILAQDDFKGYLRIRSLLSKDEVKDILPRLSATAEAKGYAPSFDFYEFGASPRGTLASVEVDDLVYILPALAPDVHERALKRIITRIESELNKKSDVKDKLVPVVRALSLSHSPLLTHYLKDPRLLKASELYPQIEGALAYTYVSLGHLDEHGIHPYGGKSDVSN